MKDLLHGTNVLVQSPLILSETRQTDFGVGFYCTTDFAQAEARALEKLHASLADEACINFYELDIIPENFKYKRFIGPTEEWIDFVYNNRNIPGFEHNYDIVYGPVADNNLKRLFILYEDGLISKQQLAYEASKNNNLKNQYLFHTERSLKLLHFKQAEFIKQEFPNGPKQKRTWKPKR